MVRKRTGSGSPKASRVTLMETTLKDLSAELSKAVKGEDYERAAKLRNRIAKVRGDLKIKLLERDPE